MPRWTLRPGPAGAAWPRTPFPHLYPLRAMGGGRISWAVRVLAALIAAETIASGAVLVLRPSPARSAALVRSLPAPTTTTTVAPDPTTLPPPPPTAPPATARRAPPPAALPADPVARLTARLDGALGGVR